MTYTEDGNSYTKHFTLAIPKDITADFDPDFARILGWSRGVKDREHITEADAYGITEITAYSPAGSEEIYRRVASLRGIEHLANLEKIQFSGRTFASLKELDLTKNSKLSVVMIPALDSLENLKLPPSVTYLGTYFPIMKDVDFSGCVNLGSFVCSNCSSLENLDLSSCTKLHYLALKGSGGPVKVDLSGCVNLEELMISNKTAGGKLTELKLPKHNDELRDVRIINHSLTEFPVGDYPSLFFLIVRCQLTELDIRSYPKLRSLGCEQNPGKDGKFIVTSWFDDSSIPEGFDLHNSSWMAADGTEVKVEFRKVQ